MFILHQSLSTLVGARTIKLKKIIKQAIRGAEISEPALPNQENFRPARESFEGNSKKKQQKYSSLSKFFAQDSNSPSKNVQNMQTKDK